MSTSEKKFVVDPQVSLLPQPKVCAVMVTFNPGQSLGENVNALLPQVSRLIIVDNGSSPSCRAAISQLSLLPNVEVVWNNTNLGIAAALNAGIRFAAGKFSWIATFDQDSKVSPGFMASMWRAYCACPFREHVAIIGSRCEWELDGLTRPAHHRSASFPFKELWTTMTSGSLVRADIFDRCGMFDESFFIDYVDHEFCLRARKHGFRVIEAVDAPLTHALGLLAVRRIFGLSVTVSHHSPVRWYYTARNRLRTYFRYFLSDPSWVFFDAWVSWKEFLKLALFGQDRCKILADMMMGIRDAIAGRSGAYPS